MQYLVMSLRGKEVIFLAPKFIEPEQFLDAIRAIRFGDPRNWERELFDEQPIGRGQLSEVGFYSDGGLVRPAELYNAVRMKYIVTILSGKEAMFVFPKEIDHHRFAEALENIRYHDYYTQDNDGTVVSAGFIRDSICAGKSETLDLISRPALDCALYKKQRLAQSMSPETDSGSK